MASAQSWELTGIVGGAELVPVGGGTELGDAMNPELLIDAIVSQTMAFVAQLATNAGTRAPLGRLPDQVFHDLTRELGRRGVTTKVVADMFGMATRTYHRRVQETEPRSERAASTVWQEVLELVQSSAPLSGQAVRERFLHVSPELIAAVLNDLVHSGLARRAGWGERAVYHSTPASDGRVFRRRSRGAEPAEPDASERSSRHASILEQHRAMLTGLLAELELGSGEPVGQVAIAGQTG